MKKNLLWTMAAAVALASCSDTELVEMPQQAQEQNAIAFSTYVGDNAQSRATVVTTDTIARNGFVVNAWYTKASKYAEASDKEAFMTDTKVTRNDNGVWTYSPLKYWPNMKDHMVSFFAYGPSKLPENCALTNNKDAIDFTVENEVKKQVDLIYNTNYDAIDMPKPAVNTRVEFKFDHALARIAFSVEAAVDVVESDKDKSENIDANTVINVKRVALVGANAIDGQYIYSTNATDTDGDGNFDGPFYTNGTLSLLEPETDVSPWSEQAGGQSFLLNGDNFYRTIKVGEEEVVQLHKFNRKQMLTNEESYLMVIPQDLRTADNGGTSDGFKIYIEYDVITEGADGSTITNHIVSKDAMSVNFEQGKAYKFNLVLGMASVQFDASVASWTEYGPEYEEDEWLPGDESEEDDEDEGDDEGDGELPDNIEGIAYNAETNTFSIKTADELATLATKVNSAATYEVNGITYYWSQANYIQIATIDLSTVCGEGIGNWKPIGNEWNGNKAFTGTFDGAGYSIKNLYYNGTEIEYVGLFGVVGRNGKLVDIHIASGSVTNNNSTGKTGAILGAANEPEGIIYCSNAADVTTSGMYDYAGGIVGGSHTSVIACYNTGNISASFSAGGIAGDSYQSGRCYACYNTGTVKANTNAGGIVGIGYQDFIACYNTGDVVNATNIGGIIGNLEKVTMGSEGSFIACFYGSPCTATKAIGTISDDYENTMTNVPETATTDWEDALTKMNAQLTDETGNYGYHYVNKEGNIVLTPGNAE